jgi:threonine dehydrogenase-like Zn-dependent dehydrogenase
VSARTEYAITFTRPDQAELLAVEPPAEPLGPNEIAGRTLVTLISVGSELRGGYRRGPFPRVPGYAAVCEAEDIGAEVSGITAGDHLFVMGPHRSFQRCSVNDALRVPDGLPPETAVFARMMAISMSTLATTAVRPPEKVLVTGLGLVGHLAARIFSLCGYEVTACEPSALRRDIAARNGVERALPALPLDDPAYIGKVGLVVECSGHEQATLDACRLVRRAGEVVLVGVPWERRTEIYAHDLLFTVFDKYVVLRSGWEWQIPLHDTEFRGNSIFGDLAAALQWLAQGCITVAGLYDLAPPREAQRAYQDFRHERAKTLTTVFDWSDCP